MIAWVRDHGHPVRRQSGAGIRGRELRGWPPGRDGCPHPRRPRVPARLRGADTSVTAAICLYGYYGNLDTSERLASTPLAYVGTDAPPFFVAHGDQDTVVLVDDARRFVQRLQASSLNPVVYAELPGAQHVFDLFHSLRFETVVDAIEGFAAW